MPETIVVQGQRLTPEDIQLIQSLMKSHPDWHRQRLSRELAALWNWTNSAGRPKDMAARTMLLKLERRGLIKLPERRREPVQRKGLFSHAVSSALLAAAPIAEPLGELTPVTLELLSTKHPAYPHFQHYLAKYHYLGWRGVVGEHAAYLARDCKGRDLACLCFGAAAWKVGCRDRFIGWDHPTRERRLGFIANNSRFLVLARVPHLASHLLAIALRRLSGDWQAKYGHPIWLVETFVDSSRYRGTCYRAANWRLIGQTQGRSRQDRYGLLRVPVKDVYLYPLTQDFREKLCHVDA